MNLYGRTPNMLPDINIQDEDIENGTIRHANRLREISLQQTLEGTAAEKVKRALNSKTRIAGQQQDYKIGELLDYYRTPPNKDSSGWRGPAKVVDNTEIDWWLAEKFHRF